MKNYGMTMLPTYKVSFSDLSYWERTVYKNLIDKLYPYLGENSQRILREGNYDISNLSSELQDILLRDLSEIYIDTAVSFSRSGGDAIPISPSEIASVASSWAKEYTYDLVQGLTNHTEKILQNTLSYAMNNEGVTLGKVVSLLEPAFGKDRALAIAVTETTRANAMAMRGLQEHYLSAYQVQMLRYWQTNRDELVCPICGPLHNKSEEYWGDRFPNGSPAHPYCRCGITLKRASNRVRNRL